MSLSFQVYRGSKEGRIVPDQTTRSLGPNEVYIETTHSGLCGSDEHYLRSGQVLGHEGVGVVKEIGSSVTNVKVGDRVGFGYTQEVCGLCDSCLSGWDQYCSNKKEYGRHNHDVGSFSSGVVWNAGSVFPIPDRYDSKDAAPLMCAGGTVWTCLSEYGARPGDRVGVIGIGGLGHLAIKLAAAMGCHVVALSGSDTKKEEAFGFGASEYYVFSAGKEYNDLKPLKHLLVCANANIDYASLISIMDIGGTIYPLTVDFRPSSVPLLPMTGKGVRLQGSLVASRRTLKSLLEFAAEKKITPTIMTFPLNETGIEDAMQTLREGKMRYRGVLVRECAR
ncbi:alcohol dehydrogenase [Paecilomyces variotii No. 5]|uniref:Alcohol dehydrogenase n=1 Tax=Byssochlamys spectabilis (strain No. 5 / NBRC 109023) TaxID=1356009 RepID=V5FPP4_BYSSN|nr:alcohol dehydrogenase [Paecilomyces variotii No. 5]